MTDTGQTLTPIQRARNALALIAGDPNTSEAKATAKRLRSEVGTLRGATRGVDQARIAKILAHPLGAIPVEDMTWCMDRLEETGTHADHAARLRQLARSDPAGSEGNAHVRAMAMKAVVMKILTPEKAAANLEREAAKPTEQRDSLMVELLAMRIVADEDASADD